MLLVYFLLLISNNTANLASPYVFAAHPLLDYGLQLSSQVRDMERFLVNDRRLFVLAFLTVPAQAICTDPIRQEVNAGLS